jgi:hypothetical protein
MMFQGATGSVLINDNGDRMNKYTVWSYGPGLTAYYSYMNIDFAKPANQVRTSVYFEMKHWNNY